MIVSGPSRAAAAALTSAMLIACGEVERDPLLDELGVIGDDVADASDDADDGEDPDHPADGDHLGAPDGRVAGFAEALEQAEAHYAAAIAARLRDGAVTDEVEAGVTAAFEPAFAARILASLGELGDEDLAVFRPAGELGPRRHTRITVLERTDGCVYLETVVDGTPLVVDAPPAEPTFVVLRSAASRDDVEADAAGWAIAALPDGDLAALRTASPC